MDVVPCPLSLQFVTEKFLESLSLPNHMCRVHVFPDESELSMLGSVALVSTTMML